MKLKQGFTLVELIIVILIIGILAALALPQFSKAKEHAIGKEAIANLKLIAAAEKIYRMEAGTYYPSSGSQTIITNINDYLRLSITEANWDYAVTVVASTFTSTAQRQSGPYSSCQYSLAYNDPDGEPDPSASCP